HVVLVAGAAVYQIGGLPRVVLLLDGRVARGRRRRGQHTEPVGHVEGERVGLGGGGGVARRDDEPRGRTARRERGDQGDPELSSHLCSSDEHGRKAGRLLSG